MYFKFSDPLIPNYFILKPKGGDFGQTFSIFKILGDAKVPLQLQILVGYICNRYFFCFVKNKQCSNLVMKSLFFNRIFSTVFYLTQDECLTDYKIPSVPELICNLSTHVIQTFVYSFVFFLLF